MHTVLTETEESIVRSISGERLMADTGALARWVRVSGSDEERRAFDHVEDTLRELGLETTRHPARVCISVPEGAELSVEGRAYAAITHSMGASTPDGGLVRELAYVGAGRPDDYAAHDVRDKIVVVDGIAMPGRVASGERAGAAGAIFANRDVHVHEMMVSGVWGSPTPATRALLPRLPVVSVAAGAGDPLRERLASDGRLEARLTARVRTQWTEVPTLVAQLDAPANPREFVLFSGHIDSWHYGAMDNGSANATMLETLRALLPHRDALRRSLRLAFWSGHSQGRYAGSTWYADNFWEDLHDNCVLHLNVDSVGGQNATVLTEAHTMAETRSLAAGVIGDLTGVEFTGTRFGRAGDQSFLGHGMPSLFMSLSEQPPGAGDTATGFAELVGGEAAKSGGLGWWWHTTEDTVDKIDPDLLVRDTRIYALVAYRFLSRALLPLDIRASAADLLAHLRSWQDRAGRRFDLGSVLERAEETARCAAELQDRVDALSDEAAPGEAERLNAALRAAGSFLVRVGYTASDAFDHDPALSQPPVPLLAAIDELVEAEPGSDAEGELLTLLTRRRNRVGFELREAARALRRGLAA